MVSKKPFLRGWFHAVAAIGTVLCYMVLGGNVSTRMNNVSILVTSMASTSIPWQEVVRASANH